MGTIPPEGFAGGTDIEGMLLVGVDGRYVDVGVQLAVMVGVSVGVLLGGSVGVMSTNPGLAVGLASGVVSSTVEIAS